MIMPAKPIVATLIALALACCAGDPNVGPRQEGGTVLGAIAGGLVGASLGNSAGSRVAGAVIGATAGGILGNAIGANLDERDRQRAYAAEVQALEQGEPGEPVGWRGNSAGRYGTVVPGAYYDTRGIRCRDYTHTIYIDGRPQTARATACRNPDGSWSPVG
jgi:surface antigen